MSDITKNGSEDAVNVLIPEKLALVRSILRRIDQARAELGSKAGRYIGDRHIEAASDLANGFIRKLRQIDTGEADHGFNYDSILKIDRYLLSLPASFGEDHQNTGGAASAQ
jgi:hypothetical protein